MTIATASFAWKASELVLPPVFIADLPSAMIAK
jgi:hypothetical protein